MAFLVPDDLWVGVAPLLPPARAKPKGGRPRVPDRAAPAGILSVLRTGIRWHEMSGELGCCGRTCWRRLRVGSGRVCGRRCTGPCWSGWRVRDNWTGAGPRWTAPRSRRKGGEATGPNPTDRGKRGTRRHLVVDARGPARRDLERGQPPRQHHAHGHAGCGARRALGHARSPAPTPRQVPRRQGLRSRALSSRMPRPWRRTPHRPAWHRVQPEAGQAQAGRGAHAGVAGPALSLGNPLRTTRRSPLGPHGPRLRSCLSASDLAVLSVALSEDLNEYPL